MVCTEAARGQVFGSSISSGLSNFSGGGMPMGTSTLATFMNYSTSIQSRYFPNENNPFSYDMSQWGPMSKTGLLSSGVPRNSPRLSFDPVAVRNPAGALSPLSTMGPGAGWMNGGFLPPVSSRTVIPNRWGPDAFSVSGFSYGSIPPISMIRGGSRDFQVPAEEFLGMTPEESLFGESGLSTGRDSNQMAGRGRVIEKPMMGEAKRLSQQSGLYQSKSAEGTVFSGRGSFSPETRGRTRYSGMSKLHRESRLFTR